jgi:hypothetical protein
LPWANHAFDSIINGPGGQLIFQYMSQFIVWAITNKRINQIEKLANQAGLNNIFAKEKLNVVKDIQSGKDNSEIKTKLERRIVKN